MESSLGNSPHPCAKEKSRGAEVSYRFWTPKQPATRLRGTSPVTREEPQKSLLLNYEGRRHLNLEWLPPIIGKLGPDRATE